MNKKREEKGTLRKEGEKRRSKNHGEKMGDGRDRQTDKKRRT